MRNLASLSFLLALAVMLVGASTSTAHAYLDPGTGSIILQVLLGGDGRVGVGVQALLAKIRLHDWYQAQTRGPSGDPAGPGLTSRWGAEAEPLTYGVRLTATTANPKAVAYYRGLHFIGYLAGARPIS